MKSKSSSGINDVSSKILKLLTPDNMINCLTQIFNLSINKSKIAKVIPILKKGTPLDVNNYRPIGLFPVVSKIIERIVYNSEYSYFTRNNFF